MQVSEFVSLLGWIEQEIVQKKVQGRYQDLINVLNQNNQSGQARAAFEGQREKLITTLRSVDLLALTEDQLAILGRLGIEQNVGNVAADAIEKTLIQDAADLATIINKIQKMSSQVDSGVQRSQQLAGGLKGLSPPSPAFENEVVLRVAFKDNASIRNVVDLKKWTAIWHDIGRGIAVAHRDAPESVRVVGATTGSLILYLGVTATVASTISFILLRGLSVADRYLDIRKKAEELRLLKVKNDQLIALIEQEAEKERARGIESLVTDTRNQLNRPLADGEEANLLQRSIESLVQFVSRGGTVDCALPPPPPPPAKKEAPAPTDKEITYRAQIERLREQYRDIRAQEKKLSALEFLEKDGSTNTQDDHSPSE